MSRQSAHESGKVSPAHRPSLPPRKYSWYSFLLEAVNPRATVWPEGLCQWKIPVAPSGIEPGLYRSASTNCVTACPTPLLAPTLRMTGFTPPLPVCSFMAYLGWPSASESKFHYPFPHTLIFYYNLSQFIPFVISALGGGVWSTQRHAPDRFNPREELQYPLYRRPGGLHGRSGRVWRRESQLPSPGFEAGTLQPVATLYTGWHSENLKSRKEFLKQFSWTSPKATTNTTTTTTHSYWCCCYKRFIYPTHMNFSCAISVQVDDVREKQVKPSSYDLL